MDEYMTSGYDSYRSSEDKRVFNPRIEKFSAFYKPFESPSSEVVSSGLEKAAACCACAACTACRQY
jgi:hypothetical protein